LSSISTDVEYDRILVKIRPKRNRIVNIRVDCMIENESNIKEN
jgi:hypothetical protein